MVESADRHSYLLDQEDQDRHEFNYVRRLSLHNDDEDDWVVYASSGDNHKEQESNPGRNVTPDKYTSESGIECQPTFGSRINCDSYPV